MYLVMGTDGDRDEDQRGWYGDGDDCWRDRVATGTKSVNGEGTEWRWGLQARGQMGMGTEICPCPALYSKAFQTHGIRQDNVTD